MAALDAPHRFARLRSYRVNLRREIDRLEHLLAWGSGDALDVREARAARQRELRATEREWLELKATLHLPAERPPIKLAARR
jgi:hypothetical protein